jgi:hypothetical protein
MPANSALQYDVKVSGLLPAMLTMYPERVHPYTVWLSASRLLGG